MSKVVLFVTTSPELAHWNESLSALTFAARCRSVDLARAAPPAALALVDAHAATEAELAAANKKVHDLSALLRQKGL